VEEEVRKGTEKKGEGWRGEKAQENPANDSYV